jgi:hypothetical protein
MRGGKFFDLKITIFLFIAYGKIKKKKLKNFFTS